MAGIDLDWLIAMCLLCGYIYPLTRCSAWTPRRMCGDYGPLQAFRELLVAPVRIQYPVVAAQRFLSGGVGRTVPSRVALIV